MGSESRAHGCRDVALRSKLEWRTVLVSGMTALALAWVIPAAASIQRTASTNTQQPATTAPLVFDGVTVVDVEQGKLLPAQRVVIPGTASQPWER
jgi:hypothetical protein